VVFTDRTRGNAYTFKNKKFFLNTRKHFFSVRVVKHWMRLPREVTEYSCLEIYKTQLQKILDMLL